MKNIFKGKYNNKVPDGDKCGQAGICTRCTFLMNYGPTSW